MTTIAFIGLGNMGGPMAANLVKAGHSVLGVDLVPDLREAAAAAGVKIADSAGAAAAAADVVVTMLPAGRHVLGVWGELAGASPARLWIDSSTIDVDSARKAHALAAAKGALSVDAPVSGGVGGAKAATLTFMCGGAEAAFAAAKPILETDGQAHRPLRRGGRRAGGENLQQHDPRRDDDRHLRGVRARRKARALGAGAVRRRLDLVGPKLVADQLLPGSRPGAGLARQQRLQAGLRRGADAEGPEAGAGGRRSPAAPTRRSAPPPRSSTRLFNAAGGAGADFSGIIEFLRGRG